jgi:hypothetical protein
MTESEREQLRAWAKIFLESAAIDDRIAKSPMAKCARAILDLLQTIDGLRKDRLHLENQVRNLKCKLLGQERFPPG